MPKVMPMGGIWNPTIAFWLSLLFSPVFGAIVHGRNWDILDNKDAAAKSYFWAAGMIVGLLICAANESLLGLLPFVYLGSLVAWYFKDAQHQVVLVSNTYGESYEKRPWWGPVIGALFCWFILNRILRES